LVPVYNYSQFWLRFPTQPPPCVRQGIRSRPDRLGCLMRDINQITISITNLTQSPPCVRHGVRSRPDRLGHLMGYINQITISFTILTQSPLCVWHGVLSRLDRVGRLMWDITLFYQSPRFIFLAHLLISLALMVTIVLFLLAHLPCFKFNISYCTFHITWFVFHAHIFTFNHRHGLSNNKAFLFKTFKHTFEQIGVLGTLRFLTQAFISFPLKHNLRSRHLDMQALLWTHSQIVVQHNKSIWITYWSRMSFDTSLSG